MLASVNCKDFSMLPSHLMSPKCSPEQSIFPLSLIFAEIRDLTNVITVK